MKTFVVRSHRDKKGMPRREVRPGRPISPMHHSEVELEKYVIYRHGTASSVGLLEDAMNALHRL